MSGYLYHYTDETGKKGIQRDNLIHPSKSGTSRDAHFGTGVYLTKLGPKESDEVLVKNNFGRNYKSKHSRVRFYVRFSIGDLHGVKKEKADGRDVYLYKTETGIDLIKSMVKLAADLNKLLTSLCLILLLSWYF